MAEFRSGLLLDVGFETLPVVFGSVYLVTVGTDRNQLLELVNFSRKPKNSIRDTQSHPNRDGIKRLRQEIVNAGLSGEVVVFRASLQGGEKDEIGIRCVRARPHSATKLQAVHSWHHPIAYDNAHGSAIERFPRFGSGARAHHFVSHPLEVDCRSCEATASSSAIRIFISLAICGAAPVRHDPRLAATCDH